MAIDVQAAGRFYSTPRGGVAAKLLRERLHLLWPDLTGQAVLGLGYVAPYLRLWREGAARCVCLSPAQIGAARWPAGRANLSCTAEEDALPFPDLLFDRVLLVHGLESAENGRRMLREVWRVLRDDGSLMVVAPNRHGLWAHAESTPFGHGHPYSPGQIATMLTESLFRVERRDTALFMPPSNARMMLRTSRWWEHAGRAMVPHLAGVTITEAVKDVQAAIPLRPAFRRRMLLADAA